MLILVTHSLDNFAMIPLQYQITKCLFSPLYKNNCTRIVYVILDLSEDFMYLFRLSFIWKLLYFWEKI